MADQGRTLGALEELATALDLPGPPMRIECYDISNFQGSQSVGSMVVFEEGRPRSGEYRRFRIRTVEGPNDFASHQEVLRRRFRRARIGDEGAEEAPLAGPDLIVIDGGRGQVAAAKEVLDELGLHDMPLAGLAKEREELFLPAPPADPSADVAGASTSSSSATRPTGSPSRTTATCGRRRPSTGVRRPARRGPKRRRALLRVFGSTKRVRTPRRADRASPAAARS
jgi:excinuclease ABC subunit C